MTTGRPLLFQASTIFLTESIFIRPWLNWFMRNLLAEWTNMSSVSMNSLACSGGPREMESIESFGCLSFFDLGVLRGLKSAFSACVLIRRCVWDNELGWLLDCTYKVVQFVLDLLHHGGLLLLTWGLLGLKLCILCFVWCFPKPPILAEHLFHGWPGSLLRCARYGR